MFRYTPKPWVAWFNEPDADGFITRAGIDTSGRGAGIVEIEVLAETLLCDHDATQWNETLRGDTHLMTASPFLYEACLTMREWLGKTDALKDNFDVSGLQRMLQSVIALVETGV